MTIIESEVGLGIGSWKQFVETYETGPVIGTGSFSTVRKVVHRDTGIEYAGKFTTRQEAEKELIAFRLLRKDQAVNLLTCHAVFEDDSGHYMCIVSDLMRGPNLQAALDERGSFSEEDARAILRQIINGLMTMHKAGVVHRDLKLENVLLPSADCNTTIKIADFGLSALWSSSEPKLRTRCGTPAYVAPEVVPKDCEYDNQVDVWSAGVILFMLLGGFPPFQGSNVADLLTSIVKENLQLNDPSWELTSKDAKDLVQGMLRKDPSCRLSLEEALLHPWMTIDI